jgi:hypothetical protein
VGGGEQEPAEAVGHLAVVVEQAAERRVPARPVGPEQPGQHGLAELAARGQDLPGRPPRAEGEGDAERRVVGDVAEQERVPAVGQRDLVGVPPAGRRGGEVVVDGRDDRGVLG